MVEMAESEKTAIEMKSMEDDNTASTNTPVIASDPTALSSGVDNVDNVDNVADIPATNQEEESIAITQTTNGEESSIQSIQSIQSANPEVNDSSNP